MAETPHWIPFDNKVLHPKFPTNDIPDHFRSVTALFGMEMGHPLMSQHSLGRRKCLRPSYTVYNEPHTYRRRRNSSIDVQQCPPPRSSTSATSSRRQPTRSTAVQSQLYSFTIAFSSTSIAFPLYCATIQQRPFDDHPRQGRQPTFSPLASCIPLQITTRQGTNMIGFFTFFRGLAVTIAGFRCLRKTGAGVRRGP